MEKDIKVDLIELSITSLINCLEESNKKEDFKNEIPKIQYEKIVKHMRDESTIIHMRDFHNWIKLVLITNITDFYYSKTGNEKISLLDISTGRGGDLMKWKKALITDVFAFDISDKSINSNDIENPGAKERLKGLRKKGYSVNVEFEVGDATRPLGDTNLEIPAIIPKIKSFLNKNKINSFDLISCQFALHYYFSSEYSLRNVLNLVSSSLKKGGYFFGTTIDGEKIKQYFDFLPDGSSVFKRKLYSIEKFFPKKIKNPFGNKYTFTIYDTFDKTNYFNTLGISTEYIVDFKVLNEIAKEYSLVPENINFFEKWSPTGKKKEYTNRTNNIIQFQEIFETNKWSSYKDSVISREELELSFLNSTFCFRKI